MEAEYTSIRLAELVIGESASRFDFASLCDRHYYIFQDIYEWAGKIKIRIINIEKPEPALGGISIEYSDCFDIEKDAAYVSRFLILRRSILLIHFSQWSLLPPLVPRFPL